MKAKRITRRSFVTSTALGAAALPLGVPALGAKDGARALLLSGDSAVGVNGDIRIAVAGLRGKGAQHVKVFDRLPGVRVTALCEPDPAILAKEMAKLKKKGRKIKGYSDPRILLESDEFDALVIATPNHWHALLTIWACQAGKDVYVEKPVMHSLWEGRKMLEAAKKYDRIVQSGTQTRSDTGIRKAIPYIREGNLGKVRWVHSLWYRHRDGIGKQPPRMPKEDWYDVWCGPSPKAPIARDRVHYPRNGSRSQESGARSQ